MKANLFFLICAAALFSLSVITINIAPIISKAHTSFFEGWGTRNCKILDDNLDYQKSIGAYDEYKNALNLEERKIDECRYHNIMYSLEYAAFIIDVSLGSILAFLGLIHYIEPGNNFQKISGLLGLFFGAVCTIITCIYLGFSGYIFNTEPIRNIPILYSNKASWKWNGIRYVADYDESSNDFDDRFIKIKDLSKKQYNYDSDIYKSSKDSKSDFNKCRANRAPNNRMFYQGDKECEYIWTNDVINNSEENKFLYDRWVTSIFFSALICVCGIGLCILGFLLFKIEAKEERFESPIPVPITSYTNSAHRLKNTKNENSENNQ